MKGKNMEKLYTAEEVRVALKMKMPTIRSWIHQQRLRGKLLGVHIGVYQP